MWHLAAAFGEPALARLSGRALPAGARTLAVMARRLPERGPWAQGRGFSAAPPAKRDEEAVATEAAPPAKREEEAVATGGTTQPAVQPGDAVGAPLRDEVAEPIEQILMRSHRTEVIARVGPRAERYLPTEDPNAFLLPDSRLDPGERTWQKVFVALPWMVFACMLSVPLLLVRTNLPFLQKRAEEDRRAAEAREAALASSSRVPEFEVLSFWQVPDVLERPFPTLLCLFDPETFASALVLPLLRDLEAALRAAGVRVAVAALDLTASPAPPEGFAWQYPRATSPHLQLIVPRAKDGEAGVVDYEGRISAVAFAQAADQLAGERSPEVPLEDLRRMEGRLQELREALFDLAFLEDAPAQRSWRGAAKARAEAEAARAQALRAVDISAGLEVALASCKEQLAKLQARAR